MVRSLAILAMSLWFCITAEAQGASDEVRLRATVLAVELLADFSGVATPVDFDPRFALTVRIESAVPAVTNFRAGTVVTLAVHSPSLTFAGEPVKGKTYSFLLHRNSEDGKTRFSGLRVRELRRIRSRWPTVPAPRADEKND
jgi:hypothetical protein